MADNKKLKIADTGNLTNKEGEPLKVEFAPGCFDNLDITQEELNELMADIKNMVVNGSLFDNSKTLTEEDWHELPDEVKEKLSQDLKNIKSADERRKRLN